MNSLQELGSWGSNLLGQAQNHLRPTAAVVGDLASAGLQRGSNLVSKGAKAVRTSIKDNLNCHFGAAHTFEDIESGGTRTVNEVGPIAEGAFGAVVKVTDARTGKAYALKKIICQEGVQVASTLEAAQREAQILRSLPPHPNIVQCLGYSTQAHPGGSSMVKVLMELCCGGHLLDFMDSKNGNLSPREVLEPFSQIVDAVGHLHAQRPPIQHRDLKVENVLKGSDGAWKLCDFGSCSTESVPAKELPRATLLQLQEEIDKTVTMLYRPPEMADIELNYRKGYTITEQVDIWMLGCILYTLAFYRHPFQDNATAMAISNAKYFIPEEHPMARSKKLCGLIHWLLAGDPKDRPNAARLAEVIRDIPKCSYEGLLESMPQAIKDKLQRIEDLFRKRRTNDHDMPADAFNVNAVAPRPQQPQTRQQPPKQQQAKQQAAPKQQVPPKHEAVPSTDLFGNNANAGFDLRFALAPESADNPPIPSTKSAPAAIAAAASAGPSEDLLSFSSAGNVAATGSTSKPAAAAAAPANFGLDDLLGLEGSSEAASPSRPVAPATATLPSMTMAMTNGGGSAGDDWCDFSSFSSAPPPMSSQASSSPMSSSPIGMMGGQPSTCSGQVTPSAANSQLGFEDFADFTSAPPPSSAGASPVKASVGGGSPAPVAGAPLLQGGLQGQPAAAGGAPPFFQAAADSPQRAMSSPAVASTLPSQGGQQVATPCGQAARTAKPAGGPGGAAADLSAMLAKQVDLLDL